MSKQSVSEIIDSWETHGLQNLHEINLDRIYAFPMARGDLHIHDNSVQWHLDHHDILWKRPLHNSSFYDYPLFYSMKTVVNFPKITNSGVM